MKERTRLSAISPRSWEHPADRAALAAVKQLPQLDVVVRAFVGLTTEKSLRLISLAGAVRASERQFPRVYRLAQDACYLLDWPEKPELFVSQSPLMNAGAVGVDKPFITINSSLVQALSDEELLGVIAHELSHIMSGHVLYKTLLWMLINVSSAALQVPLTGLALQGIIAALREWDRKSELSADRASMLAVQGPEALYVLLMKIAGGVEGQMNLDEFLQQAAEYESGGTMLDSVHKLLNVVGQSHPFAVVRLKELKVWTDGGAYEGILSGKYRRRDEPGEVREELDEAVRSYREEMSGSQDPLAKTLNRMGQAMEEAGKQASRQAEEFFGNLFGGGGGGRGGKDKQE